ncbi:MAG: thiamine pyrophosphate-dependent enzyme, partial [Haloarculaceae archaeon]
GATSEGDFHEAMNFAGVFSAPVVFLCENNHWAISLPRERQTASDTIAGKARAYGFEGAQVDGMDPLAVHEAVTEGLASARGGDPVLVESLTHRAGPHTTSDDPSRYRDDPDLPGWRTADPIERFADYLRAEGVIEEGFIADARADAATAMDAAIEDAEATPDPEPAELFAHVAGEIPERLAKQRAEAGAGAAAMDRSE